MLRKIFILFLMIVLINTNHIMASTDILQNGDFEEDASTLLFWNIYDWNSGENASKFGIDKSIVYSGSGSAFIDSTKENDARLTQKINVDAESIYKISCYIKTENISPENKGACISFENLLVSSRELHNTSLGWEEVIIYGETSKNQSSFVLTLGVGGYGSLNTGKAWFDDVEIEKVTKVPNGYNALKLYNEEVNNTPATKESSSNNIFYILGILIFLIFIMSMVIFRRKNNPNIKNDENSDIEYVEKIDTKPYKANRKDFLIMLIMTIIYLCIALINLGDMKGVNSYWKPSSPGESITVDFNNTVDISKIYYNFGIGTGELKIDSINKDGTFETLSTIRSNNHTDVFLWNIISVNKNVDKVKITIISDGMYINEIGFMNSNNEFIKDFNLTDIKNSNNSKGGPENLFDEQDKLIVIPSYKNGTYFDEIYHARTAYEHLEGIYPYETTHPPLGKIIISIGILIFGMNPFGWRIMGTLFGALMIPLMYMFGIKIFKKREFGFIAAFLMMFDFMHFSLSRIATIDIYGTFFIILMYYFIYDFYMKSETKINLKNYLKPLFLCGLFFGIGAASKWITIYAAPGIAFLFFYIKCKELNNIMNKFKQKIFNNKRIWITLSILIPLILSIAQINKMSPNSKPLNNWIIIILLAFIPLVFFIIKYIQYKGLISSFKNDKLLKKNKSILAFEVPYIWQTLALCIVFFIIVPSIIYISSYTPHLFIENNNYGINEILQNQSGMYDYHSKLEATHPYSSQWNEWPFMKKPIYMYSGQYAQNGSRSIIIALGNPAIWWIGVFTALMSLILALIKKDKKMFIPFVAIAFQYIPWIGITRIAFIYHYFSIVPFLIFTIVYTIKYMLEKHPKSKYIVYGYLLLVLILFIIFYPALSGMEVSSKYIDGLKWLNSWIF